jgi:hypothetical protein
MDQLILFHKSNKKWGVRRIWGTSFLKPTKYILREAKAGEEPEPWQTSLNTHRSKLALPLRSTYLPCWCVVPYFLFARS